MVSKSNAAPSTRKRVEVDTSPASTSLKRAKNGSAFARCEECNKDVPVALISMHSCSLDAKIKMNLDSQVVEKLAEVKKKPAASEKKPKSVGETKPKKEKKEKKTAAKDGNKRKRPPTAFFVFMNDFRKTFKEENPDCKSVATVAKEGGEKWKSMSDEEKKLYQDKAAELKAEFNKAEEDDEAKANADADADADAENEQEDEGESSEKETAKVETGISDDDVDESAEKKTRKVGAVISDDEE